MHRRSFLLALAVAGFVVSACGAAHAQFYDLDGFYRCLMKPDPACKATATLPPPPPPPPAPSGPTLVQVIADIRAAKLSDADRRLLDKEVAKREPRAVEALAWCKLNGLDGLPDPVAAFFLYGEAAALGVPNADVNQRAIFETRLSQEQRQIVLLRAQTPP